MNKILCIDDVPDEIIGDSALREILTSMFVGNYEVLFEEAPRKAYDLLKRDKEIKLVFLDLDFGGDFLGSEIADVIKSINPAIRIIVLSAINRQGEKIRFGKKDNVKKYVVKDELKSDLIRARIANLGEALIEDPLNAQWSFKLDDERKTITMANANRQYQKTFSVSVKHKEKALSVLYSCSRKPNECLQAEDIDGFVEDPLDNNAQIFSEIVYEINKVVRKATEWMTWGILDTSHCGKGAAELVIGKVMSDSTSDKNSVDSLESMAMRREIDEIKNRLEKLEKLIAIKNS